MSLRNTVSLHVFFWIYLIVGSAIFYAVELPAHLDTVEQVNSNETQIVGNLLCSSILDTVSSSLGSFPDADYMFQILELFHEACLNITSPGNTEPPQPLPWDFSAALFLSMTILTTIGYGNLVPLTNPGKVFCILYGFIGIPLAGILLASTSDYFSNHLLLLYNRQRKQHQNEKVAIVVATLVYLVPGVLLFLFVPAGFFTIAEGWTYLDGLYFSFVTLTTIGFGDLVAAQHAAASWLWVYRVGAICWIIVGIGYWAMIIAFVTKAFKSKELKRRWHQTATAIAHHVEEFRKVVEHSIQQNKFVPGKSKAVFEFALNFSGSIAHLEPEVDRRLSVPSIVAATKPHNGIAAILRLPLLMAGHLIEHPVTVEKAQEKFANSRTLSEDSGVNIEDYCSDTKPRLSSCSSLPTVCGFVSKQPTPLQRSYTRPELCEASRTAQLSHKTLKDLLMDAMVILEESETRGDDINTLLPTRRQTIQHQMP